MLIVYFIFKLRNIVWRFIPHASETIINSTAMMHISRFDYLWQNQIKAKPGRVADKPSEEKKKAEKEQWYPSTHECLFWMCLFWQRGQHSSRQEDRGQIFYSECLHYSKLLLLFIKHLQSS